MGMAVVLGLRPSRIPRGTLSLTLYPLPPWWPPHTQKRCVFQATRGGLRLWSQCTFLAAGAWKCQSGGVLVVLSSMCKGADPLEPAQCICVWSVLTWGTYLLSKAGLCSRQQMVARPPSASLCLVGTDWGSRGDLRRLCLACLVQHGRRVG